MANIDTPGYRAVGMDFEAEMREAMDGAAADEGAQPVHVRFEDGLVARPDGNNVSMDRESLNLAEAQLKFRTGIALLRQQYQYDHGRNPRGQRQVRISGQCHPGDECVAGRHEMLFGLMETSGSAMQAERMRAEVVAANMANAETTRTRPAWPYRRQEVVFAANRGR